MEDIRALASSHFEDFYKNDSSILVRNQLMAVKEYPRFFNEEEGEELFQRISMSEVKVAIHASAGSKIPGPDEWTMELFVACLEFMGHDLLDAIEESRVIGTILGAINSTFLALI